jgi:hypothetical protein
MLRRRSPASSLLTSDCGRSSFSVSWTWVLSVSVGVWVGRWHALKWCSAGNTNRARWALHRGGLVASVSSIVLLFALFGWPWKSQTVNALEEFTESVIVPEEGAVAALKTTFAQVRAWSTGSKASRPTTTRTATGIRPVAHTERHFSPWLLLCDCCGRCLLRSAPILCATVASYAAAILYAALELATDRLPRANYFIARSFNSLLQRSAAK